MPSQPRASHRGSCAHAPDHAYVAIAIEHLALALALRGDLLRAATLEGYVEATFARHGFAREFTEATTYDRIAAVLRAGLYLTNSCNEAQRALHSHQTPPSHSRLRNAKT